MSLPTLDSERLRLRPFSLTDAADVQRLAGDFAIADTTLNVPHPYEDGMAEQWIAGHAQAYEHGRLAAFAITEQADGRLLGAISIKLGDDRAEGELGYWVGRPYWGRGVATAAAKLVIDFGFAVLGLERVVARHFARNPASGRVMQKLGMQPAGIARGVEHKWGRPEDLVSYAISRELWQGSGR